MSSNDAETYYFGVRTRILIYGPPASVETVDMWATSPSSVPSGTVSIVASQPRSISLQAALLTQTEIINNRRHLKSIYPLFRHSHRPFARSKPKKVVRWMDQPELQMARRTNPLPPLPHRPHSSSPQSLDLIRKIGTICNRKHFIEQALILLRDAVSLSVELPLLHSAEVSVIVLTCPIPLTPNLRKVVKKESFQVKVTIKLNQITFYHIISPWHTRLLVSFPIHLPNLR